MVPDPPSPLFLSNELPIPQNETTQLSQNLDVSAPPMCGNTYVKKKKIKNFHVYGWKTPELRRRIRSGFTVNRR